MKIKINDWKVWLIRAFYGIEKYELPKSRCEFIKKLMLAQVFCILFPLFTAYLILYVVFDRNARTNPSERIPPVVFMFVTMLALLIGENVWHSYFFENLYWTWPLFMLLILIGVIAAFMLIVGIISAGEWLIEKLKSWNGKPSCPKPELYDDLSYRDAVVDYYKKLDEYNTRRKNSNWHMLKEWIHTRKQSVCPPVEYIIDDEA